MIKFLLIMQVCSSVHMDCMPQFEQSLLFETHSSCVMSGHLSSMRMINDMGEDFVERARIQIKFNCKKVNES